MQLTYEPHITIRSWLLPPRRFFSIVGGLMLRPRTFEFYTFATYIHPITEVLPGTAFKGNPEIVNVFTNAGAVSIIFYTDAFCIKYLPSSVTHVKQLYQFISTAFPTSPARGSMPDTVRDVDVTLTVYRSQRCKGFVGYGDADPSNVSALVHGAEMRVAETRAVNRALRKAWYRHLLGRGDRFICRTSPIFKGVEEASFAANKWQLRRSEGPRPPLPTYPPAPTRCQPR